MIPYTWGMRLEPSGINTFGLYIAPEGNVDSTYTIIGLQVQPKTVAASFAVERMIAIDVIGAVKGSGSTITHQYGLWINDLDEGVSNTGARITINEGANKRALFVNGGARNYISGKTIFGSQDVETSSAYQLEVKGPATSAAYLLNGTATSATVDIENSATSGDNVYANFYSASLRGQIYFNRAGGTVAYGTTSDARLKNIHGDAPNQNAVLKAIRIRSYTMKDGKQKTIGPVAQELHAVLPNAVKVGGSDPKKEPWSVDRSALVPSLVVGWQDHEARIAALEARIKVLEKR